MQECFALDVANAQFGIMTLFCFRTGFGCSLRHKACRSMVLLPQYPFLVSWPVTKSHYSWKWQIGLLKSGIPGPFAAGDDTGCADDWTQAGLYCKL
jgi:hypothetical protein